MADVFLLRACALCSSLFCICRRHDRGHAYCSRGCRISGRQRSLRQARATYQRSPEGRADQRDRMRLRRRQADGRVMDQGSEKLAQSGSVIARVHACDSTVEPSDMPAKQTNDRIDDCDDSPAGNTPADRGAQRPQAAAAGPHDSPESLDTASGTRVAAGPFRVPSKAALCCIVCGRVGHLYGVGHVASSSAKHNRVAHRISGGSQQAPPRR